MIQVLEYFYEHVVLNDGEANLQLFQESIGQGETDEWHYGRDCRLNGSTSYKILKAKFNRKTLQDFINTIWGYWKSKVPQVEAVEHGTKTEHVAIKKFKASNPQYTVVPAGEIMFYVKDNSSSLFKCEICEKIFERK